MQDPERSRLYTSAVLSGPICGMLGVGWDAVLARAGIVATERNDRAFLVSADEYLALWAAMMDLSSQQDVSKLLGLRMASGPAIPVLFALSTAADFETGIGRMSKFKSLFGPMRFIVSRTTSEFSVRVAPDRYFLAGILQQPPDHLSSRPGKRACASSDPAFAGVPASRAWRTRPAG